MHALAPIRPTTVPPSTGRPSTGRPASGRTTRLRTTEGRQCRIELVSSSTAPAEARQQVRAVLRVWGVPVEAETAELLTSELVTNAFLHDAGEWIALSIRCCHGMLRVDVHDSASGLPVQQAPPGSPETTAADDAENGRGLTIVETLADEWGFYRTATGKAVYFALSFPGENGLQT